LPAELKLFRRWRADPGLVVAIRDLFVYGEGDNRSTGYLYASREQDWQPILAGYGPVLLADLEQLCAVRFTVVAFQGYRDGAGCDWHSDEAFDAQAILSLGVTRTFGVRQGPSGAPRWLSLRDGDLVFMPSGFQTEWQHTVPVEDVPGERVSLVFRTRQGDVTMATIPTASTSVTKPRTAKAKSSTNGTALMSRSKKPSVLVISARVDTAAGIPVATITRIAVGGGAQAITVDGVAEEKIHPTSTTFHVRFLAPPGIDVPDVIHDAATYEEAVEMAEAYASRIETQAEQIAAVTASLQAR
jgi:hypothetical protein